MSLNSPVTAEDIEHLFEILMGRSVGDTAQSLAYINRHLSNGTTVAQLITEIKASDEFARRFGDRLLEKNGLEVLRKSEISDLEFRIPTHLSRQKLANLKVLLVGSCLMNGWEESIEQAFESVTAERILVNNASKLPDISFEEANTISFQIIQIPLRSILPEAMYFNIQFSDAQKYQDIFELVCSNLNKNLDALLSYNQLYGVVSYVMNFSTPIQNNMGRMSDRYSLSNMVYFIDELNRHLYEIVSLHKNVYVIDVDQINATYGKRYFQDDSVSHTNHGSYLMEIAKKVDRSRLEPIISIKDLYNPKPAKYINAIFNEALAAFRSLHQIDSIKLAIFDLDDTLWRGVAAENEELTSEMVEGWPLGVLEAVSYLWRRGILIALCSKNDEQNVIQIWHKLYSSRFNIDHFVIRKINWDSKVDNVREILAEVNLLPSSVLFVDDNPAERAAVKTAFPEIRTIDLSLAEWRRVLLWSAETQFHGVTEESIQRTETIKAQIKRNHAAKLFDRDEHLRTLDVKLSCSIVANSANVKFSRIFELINKTNQFNTTGKRWTLPEIDAFIKSDGYFVVVEVSDIYTDYGLVGVVVVGGDNIEQAVLSCRVFGIDVEFAMIHLACETMIAKGKQKIFATLKHTDKNKNCLNLYRDMNFCRVENDDGLWFLKNSEMPSFPNHISLQSNETHLAAPKQI